MKELSKARRDLAALYPDYSVLVSCTLARHVCKGSELLKTEYIISIIESCFVLVQVTDITVTGALQKVYNEMAYLHK